MSAANDLIERMERETGQRIDETGPLALAGLTGALARDLGVSNHEKRDDVAAGLMMTPEALKKQRHKEMTTNQMLATIHEAIRERRKG